MYTKHNMLALIALLPVLALASPIAKRDTNVYIQSGRDGLCLSLSGDPSNLSDGVPVDTVPCLNAITWDINHGSGSVLVHGNNNFALDAGSNPGNFGTLKIWQSYPGLYQQTWFLTGDNRIAITGGNQCLDEGDTGPQTYQCTTGDTNQVWNLQPAAQGGSGGSYTTTTSTTMMPTTTTTSTTASPTSTTPTSGGGYTIPTGTVYQDPSGGGQRLHPNGRADLCVTVVDNAIGDGGLVEIAGCFPNGDYFSQGQLFDLPAPGATGAVQVHGTNFCLDAGSNPSNGGGMKVWQCYSGLLQQTWTRSGQTGTLSLSDGQCLDVTAGSAGIYPDPPNSYVEQLQTWQCSNNGDPQQVFFTL